MKNDKEKIKDYFNILNSDSGYIQISSVAPRQPINKVDYCTNNFEEFKQAIKDNQKDKELHMLANVATKSYKRSKDKDIKFKTYVAFDLDVKFNHDDQKKISEFLGTLARTLFEGFQEKKDSIPFGNIGAIVKSGQGLHVFYKIKPIELTDNNRKLYKEIYINYCKELQELLKKLEEKKDINEIKVDQQLSNPSHLLRMPFSYNNKKEYKTPIRTKLLYSKANESDLFNNFESMQAERKKGKIENKKPPRIDINLNNSPYPDPAKTKLDDQLIQKAKNTSIEEIVKKYSTGKIENAGANKKKICCLLHKEKTASMTLYTDTNSFYCYGCGKGGDVIKLIQELEKCSFVQAVEKITGEKTIKKQPTWKPVVKINI